MEKIQPKIQVQTVQDPKIKKTKFYTLLLMQVIIVFVSTIFIDNSWYYTEPYKYNPRLMTSYFTYCEFNIVCRKNPDGTGYKEYQEWRASAPILTTCDYQDLFLLAFTCYPFFIFIQTILKHLSIPSILQMLIYVIQIPPMILYTQAILSEDGLSESMKEIRQFAQISLVFLMLNLTFLLLNGYLFKFNINHNKLQKLILYIYLSLSVFIGIGHQLDLCKSNFSFQILFFMHLQLYLIKLDTYLFDENNKFSKQNKHLLEIIDAKLIKRFETSPHLKKIKSSIIIILVSIVIILYKKDFVLLIIIVFNLFGIFILLTWDVSLLSTQAKLNEKDSYLAANLFFLDACLPLQSLLLEYLVDD